MSKMLKFLQDSEALAEKRFNKELKANYSTARDALDEAMFWLDYFQKAVLDHLAASAPDDPPAPGVPE